MSKHRRAARVDENQRAIVKTLRAIPSVSVAVGHDDILVGFLGRTYWFEIKRDQKANVKEGQKKLRDTWRGHYQVVHCVDEIFDAMGIGQ
jgi:hypothetical protein